VYIRQRRPPVGRKMEGRDAGMMRSQVLKGVSTPSALALITSEMKRDVSIGIFHLVHRGPTMPLSAPPLHLSACFLRERTPSCALWCTPRCALFWVCAYMRTPPDCTAHLCAHLAVHTARCGVQCTPDCAICTPNCAHTTCACPSAHTQVCAQWCPLSDHLVHTAPMRCVRCARRVRCAKSAHLGVRCARTVHTHVWILEHAANAPPA
jgi:uncharacterized membrane protein